MNGGDGDFDLQVRDRLHIMPVGFEGERAYLAAEMLKADRVILIGHEDNPDETYLEDIAAELDDRNIPNESDTCNIFNLYGSLGMIAEKISDNLGDDVYVNVATGGKITAIAGMIACMVTGATPYYVQAEDYEPTPPEGIKQITELPRYPIDAPEEQHIEILQYINERTVDDDPPTKGNLISFGEATGLPFIAGSEVEEKSKYRILDNQIIDPLVENDYITVEESGRERIVRLTDDGENTLEAFNYMVNN